jgi:hypothetical protein
MGKLNMREEQWEKIEGTKYLVSNLGEIVNGNNNRALRACMNGTGYLQVALYTAGVKTYHTVHRLVAKAFLADFDNDFEVLHKNTDQNDCSAGNLKMGPQRVGARRG